MINQFLANSSKTILYSQLKEKVKLNLLQNISNKFQEEIKYNVSQYIKSIQASSVEISTSSNDLDKFIYKYEYFFNTLGIRLLSQDQNSILNAIKSKYLSRYPESENVNLVASYISRPSKDVWSIFGKSSYLLSKSVEDEAEQLFIDFILNEIAEA